MKTLKTYAVAIMTMSMVIVLGCAIAAPSVSQMQSKLEPGTVAKQPPPVGPVPEDPSSRPPFRKSAKVERLPNIEPIYVWWRGGDVRWNKVKLRGADAVGEGILDGAVPAMVENSALEGDADWPRVWRGKPSAGGATILDYPGGAEAVADSMIRWVDARAKELPPGALLCFDFEPGQGLFTCERQLYNEHHKKVDVLRWLESLERWADAKGTTMDHAAAEVERQWATVFGLVDAHAERMGLQTGVYEPSRWCDQVTSGFMDVAVASVYCRTVEPGTSLTSYDALVSGMRPDFQRAARDGTSLMLLLHHSVVGPHPRRGQSMTPRDVIVTANAILDVANEFPDVDIRVGIWCGATKAQFEQAVEAVNVWEKIGASDVVRSSRTGVRLTESPR